MSEPIVVTAEPYASNRDHLDDRFARADQLLKAQTVRWRSTLATTKPAEHWGMVLVGDAEIRDYLETPFTSPNALPRDLEAKMAPFWRHADALGREIAARTLATPVDVDLRFERLRGAFSLDEIDLDLLTVLLMIERDGRLRRLVGYLQDDATRRQPSVELLQQIVLPLVSASSDPDLAVGRLRRGSLIDHQLVVVEGGDDPIADRAVRLDDRIAAFLLATDDAGRRDGQQDGVLASREALERFKLPIPADSLAGIDIEGMGEGLERSPSVVQIVGPYGSGRRDAALRFVESTGRPLLVAEVASAIGRPEGWSATLERVFREARLADALVVWTGCEVLLQRPEEATAWNLLIAAAERAKTSVLLISEIGWEPVGALRTKPFLRFDLTAPSYSRRRALWTRMLPPVNHLDGVETEPDRLRLAEELANGFQLSAGQIADALVCARGEAHKRETSSGRLSTTDLFAGCRRQSGRVLNRFARRIEPRAELSFDRLVLPETNLRQLNDLRERIQHRSRVVSDLGFETRLPLGKGLVALFSGGSGTGKTLAAELLAGEQGVDLYKVDLSAVVSKYVGETEKNLDRVFAEAECSNALLFFDEADALFGKRGEVKEARDRWANLEINFLLQRIEEYPGVVVLTTNLRQNIDQAFLRRIQVIVEFPFPDLHGRLAIWKGMFPAGLERPADRVLHRFAELFQLPGGSIKNVVIDAAHRAVSDCGRERSSTVPPQITERHLALAMAREYQKLGKPITRSEFGDYYRLYETELA